MLTSQVDERGMTPDFMHRALESIKDQGGSGVQLVYGEHPGVDDAGVDPDYRNLSISWVPAGAFAHTVRVLWQGKVFALSTADFSVFPEIITIEASKVLAPDKPGFYMWGNPEVVNAYRQHGSLDYRKWDKQNS